MNSSAWVGSSLRYRRYTCRTAGTRRGGGGGAGRQEGIRLGRGGQRAGPQLRPLHRPHLGGVLHTPARPPAWGPHPIHLPTPLPATQPPTHKASPPPPAQHRLTRTAVSMGMPGWPIKRRYSGHTRSCCVTGRLVRARSKRRRMRVM